MVITQSQRSPEILPDCICSQMYAVHTSEIVLQPEYSSGTKLLEIRQQSHNLLILEFNDCLWSIL